MTLIQSAKLNGLDLYAYLNGVLQKLPTYKVIQIKRLAWSLEDTYKSMVSPSRSSSSLAKTVFSLSFVAIRNSIKYLD
ncbi:transposase domain-containing protein [Acinetobacter towneri]|uniref:transposase domain-containing protein n=1 Tax=Acinetobacter TaxID=469 RepID=UPI001F624147|nr:MULTISPECIES: transposase domain-containing protein [Acinetobacter]